MPFYSVQDCRCIVSVVSSIVLVLQSHTVSGKLQGLSRNQLNRRKQVSLIFVKI